MSDAQENKGGRDRSPAFPAIPLSAAVERLAAFEVHFKRSPARASRVGPAWGMKEKSSQADSVLAALRAYGLVEYQGSGDEREAVISEDGRTYLRAQQDSIKKEVLRRAALRPRNIDKFWRMWGADRPADAVCLDHLILKDGFSDAGAQNFLKVYDATIGYAGWSESGKVPPINDGEVKADPAQTEIEVGDLIQVEINGAVALPTPERVRSVQEHEGRRWIFIETSETGVPMEQAVLIQKGTGEFQPPSLAAPTLPLKLPLASVQQPLGPAEKEWVRGPLGRDVSYRIIVTGDMGAKEIGKLIRVLKAQQIALSEDDEEDEAAN
jgi:hypothetical protein